jgi:CheY-like chemotaxis protein
VTKVGLQLGRTCSRDDGTKEDRVDIGVLIVDDQQDIRVILRRLVEQAGSGIFVAGEAANGQDAIELADELDPAMIVLDAQMPGMDGLETAGLIRERRPDQMIILCTAFVDEETRRRAQSAGIGLAISKSQLRDVPAAIRNAVLGATDG